MINIVLLSSLLYLMHPTKKVSKLNEIVDKIIDGVNNSEESIDMDMFQRNLEAL